MSPVPEPIDLPATRRAQYDQALSEAVDGLLVQAAERDHLDVIEAHALKRAMGFEELLVDKSGNPYFLRDADGQPVLDGSYGYVLEAMDIAGNKFAKNEIEKLKLAEMSCREGVAAVAKM